jgi:CRP/FNR family transcriptional regulator
MSSALAKMLRESTGTYDRRWVAQTKSGFNTEVRPETVQQHHRYWDAIVRAVETSEFEELMAFAREAGRFQSSQGYEFADAVKRTVEATNQIELSLLETNDGAIPQMEIINEIGELRSMIVMAVAEGYKEDQEARARTPKSHAGEELRGVMLRSKAAAVELAVGDEIAPLYEGGMRFHFVDYGKLRLYNLLPNGRCITLSILGSGDIFLQWRAESQSLSCLCAEAMQRSRVVSASDRDMAEVVAAQPTAAVELMTSFARRLTESQVLIEDLMNNSVNLRLYRTLLELSKQFGRNENGASVIDVPLTHQRLADMIGSNRVTVTRKLHELQERGIVETRKNSTIVLRDAAGLAKLAESGASA